jgi:hypothetical protein
MWAPGIMTRCEYPGLLCETMGLLWWSRFRSREQDLINEHMPPPLIDYAAKMYYVNNEVRPAPPTPDSPRQFVSDSLTDSPSSKMQTLILGDAPNSYSYDPDGGYEAGLNIRSPSPRHGTMNLGPTAGTTHTSSPSMRKRSLEDSDALIKRITSRGGVSWMGPRK